MEHMPYLDRLWFGEYFKYEKSPEYWLTDVSGIPFGMMSEMLQDGGNPYRGMLYGMTAREPMESVPSQLWKVVGCIRHKRQPHDGLLGILQSSEDRTQ